MGFLRYLPLAALLAATGCSPSMEVYTGLQDGLGTTRFNVLGDEIHIIVYLTGGDQSTRLVFDLNGPAGAELSDQELFPRPSAKELGDPVNLDVQLLTFDPMTQDVLTDGPWVPGKYRVRVTLDDADSGVVHQEEELEFAVVQ